MVAGTLYYATDTSVYSVSNAGTWQTLLATGAWQNLTLASGWATVSGYYTPAARIVGDVVQLCGALRNSTGSTFFGATVATLPSSTLTPASNAEFASASGDNSAIVSSCYILSGTTAIVLNTSGFPNTHILTFDGASYRLS